MLRPRMTRTPLPQGRPIPLAIGLLWAASLALPALAAGGRSFTGFELLLQGWQGASRGVYAWFANPLFIAALVCALFARDAAAAGLAGIAALLGGTSVFAESALRDRMSTVPDIELHVGFYLWMVALVALGLRSLTRMRSSHGGNHQNRIARHSADSGRSRD